MSVPNKEVFPDWVYTFYRILFGALVMSFYKELTIRTLSGLQAVTAAVLMLGALAMIAGVRPKLASLVTGIIYIWISIQWGLIEENHIFFHHFFPLMGTCMILLSFSPCDRCLTMGGRRDHWLEIPVIPLFRLQVIVVYIFAAIGKLTPEFLSGFRLQQALVFNYGSIYREALHWDTAVRNASVAALITEFVLASLLIFPAFRKLGIAIGLCFHAVISVVLSVQIFFFLMPALLLAFLEPKDFRKIAARYSRKDETQHFATANAAAKIID